MMTLGEQIPVDELPEREWEDTERVVFAELDAGPHHEATLSGGARPSRKVGAIAAATVLAAVAAAALLSLVPSPDSEAPVAVHTSRMASGAEPSQVSLGDVQIDLAANTSAVAHGSDEQGWLVVLERGRAVFAVPPRSERPSFVVQASSVRAEVIGTRFAVERDGSVVSVEVMHGVVRVSSDGDSVELHADGSWTNAPATAETAQAEPSLLETAEAESGDPDDPQEANEPTFDASAVFDRATSLESTDPDRALRLFAEVARRPGARSAAALFAQGRLEHDRGHNVTAARLLRRYLRRHPRGVFAHDARELLDGMEVTQ